MQLYDWLGDLDRALATLVEVRGRTEHLLVDGAPSEEAVLGSIRAQLEAIAQGRASRAGVDAVALARIAHELVGYEARIRLKRGDAAGAEQLFHRILGFYRGVGAGEAIEFHIANALVRQGRVAQARTVLARIEPAFDRGLMRPRRAALRMVQADLALADGEPDTALAGPRRADRPRPVPRRRPVVEARAAPGPRAGALHRDRAALAAYDRAVGHADDLRKGWLGYRLDTTFLDDKLELFGEAVDLACALDDGDAAARFVELVKARTLAATISIPPPQRTGRTPDEVALDELSQQLDALAFQE